MVRELLSPYPASQQLAFGQFEPGSALSTGSQMAFGTLPAKMDRRAYHITNKDFASRDRWMEFMDVIDRFAKEFQDPAEIKNLFMHSGIDTRSGDIYELYLERDNLRCDYCIQVNLAQDAPFFVKIMAYAKETKKARHKH